MNKNNVYYHEKIKSIPALNVKTIVETELRDLSFDLGKKVNPGDVEFEYMVGRVVNTLTASYPEWEMMYFDTCMKNGMLDEYDKGQSLTVKRLLVWMAAFQRTLKYSINSQNEQKKEFSEFDISRMAENGSRFPQIILFRIARKPEYDADEWTLEKIEQTEDFQNFKNRSKSSVNINRNMRTSII